MSRRVDIATALAQLASSIPAFEAKVVVDRALDSRGHRAAPAPPARFFVLDDINAALSVWGVRRAVTGEEPWPSVDLDRSDP